MKSHGADFSIRYRIMMAFLLLIICWGVVLTLLLNAVFRHLLSTAGFPAEGTAEIARGFILACSGLTLAGLVLFFFVARYLARAVTEPVQQLMSGVEALGNGNLAARVPVTSRDEFGQLAESFNRMARQLGEIDRLKSEFISTVSHELRTPLASILGFAELLQAGGFSREEEAEFLAIINHKAQDLAVLIDGLLDMERLQTGQGLHLDLTSFDLAALARDALQNCDQLSSRHRFVLESPATLPVSADRQRLRQVLDNLLSNALKYSRSGTITVNLSAVPGSVRLTVRDEGIGMTAEQVAQACERFYRADASDTAIGGVGLGLAIVRNVVEAHHGTLAFDSHPGTGTTVTVTLPIFAPQVETREEAT